MRKAQGGLLLLRNRELIVAAYRRSLRRVEADGPFKVRSLAVSEKVEFALRIVLIGVGATLLMDGWALLPRWFGMPSLNFAFLGRWLGNLPRGRLMRP